MSGRNYWTRIRRLSAAKQLAHKPFDITIIDRHNYHLFQPLLYHPPPACRLIFSIRGILHRQKNAKVILAKVSGIDTAGSQVLAEGRRIPYDYLVVATGAEHAYFGHDVRAGPEDDRRRDLLAPPDPARVRTCRDRAG